MALPAWALRRGQAAGLREALQQFADQIERRLRRPLRVVGPARRRSIVLLGLPALVVHEDPQGGPLGVAPRLGVPLGTDVQLWPLLSRREWRRVLAELLVSCAAPEALPTARMQRWIVATCQRLLDTDARFWRLRHLDVVDALRLDEGLLRTALRVRLPAESRTLTWRQYRSARAHAKALGRVAEENPHLLRLAGAALGDASIDGATDPIAALAQRVRAEVSPKAWRYLAEHGVRRLRKAWQATINLPMEVVLDDLRGLQAAGWPPPLPPRLLHAWLRRAPGDLCGLLPVEYRWLRPHVLGCAARHAHATREQAAPSPSADEFIRVADWASEHLHDLDARQQGRGWRWLVRQCELHDERKRLGLGLPGGDWPSRVGAFVHESWQIEPLTNRRSVIDAKLALHNCLHTYVDRARENRVRLFGVRERESLRLVGAIGIRPVDGEAGQWRVLDVKGIANRPAPQWLPIARWIAEQYSLADGAANSQPAQQVLAFELPPFVPCALFAPRVPERPLQAVECAAGRQADDITVRCIVDAIGGLFIRPCARTDGGR